VFATENEWGRRLGEPLTMERVDDVNTIWSRKSNQFETGGDGANCARKPTQEEEIK
jgi:hypothetical protein